MARPQSLAMVDFSLDAALKQEFDVKSKIVLDWMATHIPEPFVGDSFQQKLSDGILLCKIVNCVKPNTIRKFHQNPKMLLMKKQNIDFFLDACKTKFGVHEDDLFSKDDLLTDSTDVDDPRAMLRVIAVLLMIKGQDATGQDK